MAVLKKILDLLKKYDYEHLKHDFVHRSSDAANIRGNSIEQAAKAIILKTDKGFIQCVLQGHKLIDYKKLKKVLNLKKVRLGTEEEVLELTGLTIGSIPPYGGLFELDVFVEEGLLELNYLYFSAGSHYDSIKIKPSDYVKSSGGIVKPFSK